MAMLKSMHMRGMKALVLFNMADEVVYMLWAAFFEIFVLIRVKINGTDVSWQSRTKISES